MKKDKWVWMPHPGHFICARDCRFHLNTYVGGYIVSTVGELEPSMGTREIEAQVKGITLKGIGDARRADAMKKLGWDEIGCNRTYETMVFKARRGPENAGHKCCPWVIDVAHEVDFEGYNDADAAFAGHNKLCAKWAKKTSTAVKESGAK